MRPIPWVTKLRNTVPYSETKTPNNVDGGQAQGSGCLPMITCQCLSEDDNDYSNPVDFGGLVPTAGVEFRFGK